MGKLSTYVTDFNPLLEKVATQVELTDIRTGFLNVKCWDGFCFIPSFWPAELSAIEKHNLQLIQSSLLLRNFLETDLFDRLAANIDYVFTIQHAIMVHHLASIFIA